MTTDRRVVVDTNTIVSYFLAIDSVPGRAFRKAAADAVLLASPATLDELAKVLSRRKFDPYASRQDRESLVKSVAAMVELVPVTRPIRACRDPRDDMFLEVAVNGQADLIITGDADLLALHPFHGIAIIKPAQYLNN